VTNSAFPCGRNTGSCRHRTTGYELLDWRVETQPKTACRPRRPSGQAGWPARARLATTAACYRFQPGSRVWIDPSGAVAQLVAHLVRNEGVRGPLSSTRIAFLEPRPEKVAASARRSVSRTAASNNCRSAADQATRLSRLHRLRLQLLVTRSAQGDREVGSAHLAPVDGLQDPEHRQ
jgi:hypothetical protein